MNKERWILRVGERWYIALFNGEPLYARRSLFAWRFVTPVEARIFVREHLQIWGGCLDDIHVVKLRLR